MKLHLGWLSIFGITAFVAFTASSGEKACGTGTFVIGLLFGVALCALLASIVYSQE